MIIKKCTLEKITRGPVSQIKHAKVNLAYLFGCHPSRDLLRCAFLIIFQFSLLITTGVGVARAETPIPVHCSLLTVHCSLLTEENLSQALTQKYIKQFTSNSGVKILNETMERANLYLPFIKEEIEKRGLPPEIAYLPVIESNFTITARSKSGAVGLWQFMMNSISGYNMKVTDLIDERRDFVKSTRAALQKLEDNYKVLGSWELALAAYNCGLGATTRLIKKTGVKDYWELCQKKQFKQETEHYVPKLIAVCYVIANAEEYGIKTKHEPFEWINIPLTRQVSLDIIAEEAEINKDLLRKLNAQWIHGISPAGKGYELIIPKDKSEAVLAVLEQEDIKLIKYHYHTIRKGDTLWSMSRHYGTSLDMIEQHNPGINSRYLKLGETVIIPAFKEAPAGTPARLTETPSVPVSASNFTGNYTVQKGDTLWSISRKYGVTADALAEINGMQTDGILSEGRVLKVPKIDQETGNREQGAGR